MEEKEIREFQSELRLLCEKYNIENEAFAGESGDQYIGVFKHCNTFTGMMECFANTARLYQSAREKTLGIFEQMANR